MTKHPHTQAQKSDEIPTCHGMARSAETEARRDDGAQAVRDIFTPITDTYRTVNRALTFGLDGYWRRRAARWALRQPVASALDVCTGTGDLAGCLRRLGDPSMSVTAVDFSEPMLAEARRRAGSADIVFAQADAAMLPFPDDRFDLITISFALRNLNVSRARFESCLAEFRRVLRNHGRLITVETTQPPNPVARRVLRVYSRAIVPRVGAYLSGSRPAYAYLANTIPRFHGAPELAHILKQAGFREARYTYATFGLVAIHEAIK